MPKHASTEIKRFHNKDLVLQVNPSVDRKKWDESKYEAFLDELCGTREYQKEAIQIALRYLLGGEYRSLRDLAVENFKDNFTLRDKYGSQGNLEKHLQLPNQLSASLDLATATGKSYVMYGIATIMLAEGIIDRVLILCPSTTIEDGLLEKFEALAGNANLRDLLPTTAKVKVPRVINASETIVSGCICIENYHAILAHVHSSIRDSFKGKGEHTLVLNDETHHVANEVKTQERRWKEFLTDPDFGFKYIIGLSGTCYLGNDYFSDVIYRYSLRQAMEQGFAKKIKYVAEMPKTGLPEEKWQLVFNRHEELRRKLKSHAIRPLTIIITRDISSCKDIAEKFKSFLRDYTGKTIEQINNEVLTIHSDAPDLPRLAGVNSPTSKIEWILSVSMLNEGWDVKRVFQIVPHEKRAFESKLLIAQVLGRGLRIPDKWTGETPEVTVFNHDKWADDIRHLVYEVMEFEKRIPTFPIPSSKLNFELLNIAYNPKPRVEIYPMDKKYLLFSKDYVDLSTEKATEDVKIEFENADTGDRTQWKTTIKHKTYSAKEVAEIMFHRFEDLPDSEDRKYYAKQFPVAKLEKIIELSLKNSGNKAITEGMRQKFLQSMGTLQRKASHVVRYDFEATDYYPISTIDRPQESVSASELKNSKVLFYSNTTSATIPDEYKDFYDEAIDTSNGYKCVCVTNSYDLKVPLNAVIGDYGNERKFIKELVSPENSKHLEAWIKSTPQGFYEIDYFWKKGNTPKRGKFNPDFFLKITNMILVVEIKDDDEIKDPSPENKKKNSYAISHFKRINSYLKRKNKKLTYKFNFLTPQDFNQYFQSIRDGDVGSFSSALDVVLKP